MTNIMYVQHRNFGKPNNLNVFSSNSINWPKQASQTMPGGDNSIKWPKQASQTMSGGENSIKWPKQAWQNMPGGAES